MEEGDGDFGGGDFGNGGGDRNDEHEQFHRNEAISAVADEGFMVEEEDDYEDLYNDVNVGEGVFQSLHRDDDRVLGFKDDVDNKIGGGVGGGVEANQDLGFRGGNDSLMKNSGVQQPVSLTPPPEGVSRTQTPGVGVGVGGMRVELGDPSRVGETEGQNRNSSVPSQGVMQQQPQQQPQQQQPQQQQQQLQPQQQQTPPQGGVNGGIGSGGGGYGVGNNGSGGSGGGGGTMLFVGDLHWWTTDAELEAELCKYGNVREVKFFDEKASGKSKGYCQVEFYEPSAANACKEGMNGHIFNGRPCVVQHASPFTIRRMGEAQVNKNQSMVQTNANIPPGRRGMNEGGGGGRGGNMQAGGNYQGGDGNRGYGRGNWGRGNGQGMGGRGQVGPMRNRMGGMGGGRGIMGTGGGNGFGQGLGPNPQMMHPQAMMGQGFDPAYGPNMGRMAGYGGFPAAPTPPFSGMMSSFPPVGGVGLPGVAPHVNPAFFGRGMPANGMGMMPNAGMDGHGMGMWPDPSASGWVGEDPSGRAAESSYGEDAASEHQYGDASHERGGRMNPMKEKDRTSEREWSGPPNRKYREDKDPGSDRDMPREKDAQDYDYEWSERRPHEDRELSRDRERTRDRDRYRERDTERERERDRDPDRERYREDRDRDRDRFREHGDRYLDHHKYKERGPEYDDMDHHRYKDRGPEYDDEWERGRSSRSYSKSRVSHEDDHHRARSRDAEYSKRRRLPSE